MNPYRWLCLLIPLVIFSLPGSALASFTLGAQTTVDITLTGLFCRLLLG